MTSPIQVSTEWAGNRVRIVATRDGIVQHVDACDPGSAVARRRLLRDLTAQLPSVDTGAVDKAIAAMAVEGPPPASSGSGIVPDDPPAHPEPVDGAELVRDIEARLRRYIVLPEHAGITCALWALHTYCTREFAYSPRLFVTSGTKRSGKSVLTQAVASICSRTLTADNISASAIYRVIEAASPTLICDEVDSWLVPKAGATEASEALRGITNSGFARDGCVIRCSGENNDPKRYATFGAMALAGIGTLPDTLADRSIVIRMMRRADGEQVERRPVGITPREENADLVRRCRRWVADMLPSIRETVPTMPNIASDRARDVWHPLLVLAEVAGGDVAERARAAAVALTAAVADDSEDTRTRLLGDIRDAFGDESHMTTAAILTVLHAIVDAPWAQWSAGRPMSGDALARTLRTFGVAPTRFRVGGVLVRGYHRGAFELAWNRYLPARGTGPDTPQEPSHPSHPSHEHHENAPQVSADKELPQDATGVTPVTPVTGSGEGSALSPADAEIVEAINDMAAELVDPAVKRFAGFTAEDLRHHYRAFYRAWGAACTVEAVRWRRTCQLHGHFPPLVLPGAEQAAA